MAFISLPTGSTKWHRLLCPTLMVFYTKNSNEAKITEAIKTEPVKLIDVHGNPLSLLSKDELAIQQYENHASQLLKYIIRQKNIYGKLSESELEKLLNNNIKIALEDKKSGPLKKYKYSFALASGKVKITLPRDKGDITAEFNAYSLGDEFSKFLAAGYSGYYYANAPR
ncbi:MAG: hypothetical protein ACOYMG_21330 [Candidatus Methylumidiphilus sp.]